MLSTKFAHIYTRARVRNQVEGRRSHRFTLYFWLWFESKIDYVYTSKYHGGYRMPSSRSANSHIYALARNQIETWRSQCFTLYLWLWLTKMQIHYVLPICLTFLGCWKIGTSGKAKAESLACQEIYKTQHIRNKNNTNNYNNNRNNN